MTTTMYGAALANAFGGTAAGGAPAFDYLSDDLRMALVGSAYTPNADTHDFWDDVSANEISGTGYSAGGQALASKTVTQTAANSWGTTWAAATAYQVGDVVRPTTGNGFLYRAIVAGTSHTVTEPTWPTTIGQTVTDNGVTWQCAGRRIVVFDAADPSWPNSTLSGVRYGVVYNRTPATDATRPLLCYLDFGSNQSTNNGTFTIQLDNDGLFYILTP